MMMNKEQLITAGVLGMIIIAGYVFDARKAAENPVERVVCALDAKRCDDGSYVVRTGPACEFADCPPTATSTAFVATSTIAASTTPVTREQESGIRGVVMLGPTCPVLRDPPDPACDDKPFATTLTLSNVSDGKIIKLFASNEDGTFRITLPSGIYEINSPPSEKPFPRCGASDQITVEPKGYVSVLVSCDTGIR